MSIMFWLLMAIGIILIVVGFAGLFKESQNKSYHIGYLGDMPITIERKRK